MDEPREFVMQVNHGLIRKYGPRVGGSLHMAPMGLMLHLHPDVRGWLLRDPWVGKQLRYTGPADDPLRSLFPDCTLRVDAEAPPGFWQVEIVTTTPLWGGKVTTDG